MQGGRTFQYSLLIVTLAPITLAILPRSSGVLAVSTRNRIDRRHASLFDALSLSHARRV